MVEERTYTSNLRKMFPTVLGFYDDDLQGKVRNRANSDYLESSGDTLDLLNTIKQEGCVLWSAKYALVAYHQVQVNFYRIIRG